MVLPNNTNYSIALQEEQLLAFQEMLKSIMDGSSITKYCFNSTTARLKRNWIAFVKILLL